ncbi:MAG: hypothetical protein CMJ18_27530 [Phycisphaeraceae bacterium]|nr:hypothetical protein [Phycisphaeraceae bacterium]
MLRNYFQLGGVMMWPLAACSVLLLALLFERTWTVLLMGRLLGLGRDEQLTLHRRVLPFFQDVPPSLGLLGTVIGIVQSFSLLDGQLNADAVGGGLAVACITTIFGLSIALAATAASYALDALARAPAKHEGAAR